MVMAKNVTFKSCWVININIQAYDNNWDGFAIDKVNGGLLEDNWAVRNGRHGFNIITGSTSVIVQRNFAYDNGFFYFLGNNKFNFRTIR
jgi:hypothetical protein